MIKNHKVDISEAIRAIDLDSSFIINGEVTNEEEYNNNVQFSSTPISWSDASSKQTELQTEYDNKKYQRDREIAYPSIQDQLDMQYWDKVNSTTNWQDAISKVKSDNPKE